MKAFHSSNEESAQNITARFSCDGFYNLALSTGSGERPMQNKSRIMQHENRQSCYWGGGSQKLYKNHRPAVQRRLVNKWYKYDHQPRKCHYSRLSEALTGCQGNLCKLPLFLYSFPQHLPAATLSDAIPPQMNLWSDSLWQFLGGQNSRMAI